MAPSPSPAPSVTWSAPIKVSDEPLDFMMPDRSLAEAMGATHLVWVDDGDGDLLYRRSTNLGATWAPERVLSPISDTVSVVSAAVSADGATVVVAYRTRSTTNVNALYVRRSVDKGVHWMPRTVLASYTAAPYMGTPSVAVSGIGIHVVWTDLRDGKVYYRRSVDGGATFLPRVPLAVTSRTSLNARPSVAAAGSLVYVAWSPADSTTCDGAASSLVMRRSINGGASFKPVQVVDARSLYDMPALSASQSATDSTLLATYTVCGPQRVVVARSVDAGASLTRRTLATHSSQATPWAGDVDVSGWTVRLVYGSVSAATKSYRLLLLTSTDSGATWSPPITAANRIGIGQPQVELGTNTSVLVAYQVWGTGSSLGIYTRKGALQ